MCEIAYGHISLMLGKDYDPSECALMIHIEKERPEHLHKTIYRCGLQLDRNIGFLIGGSSEEHHYNNALIAVQQLTDILLGILRRKHHTERLKGNDKKYYMQIFTHLVKILTYEGEFYNMIVEQLKNDIALNLFLRIQASFNKPIFILRPRSHYSTQLDGACTKFLRACVYMGYTDLRREDITTIVNRYGVARINKRNRSKK